MWYYRFGNLNFTFMKDNSKLQWHNTGVILLFFFFGTVSLFSAPVVRHTFHSSTPNNEFEKVLYLAAGVALVEAGYSSALELTDLQSSVVYRLHCDYLIRDGAVTVNYSFRSVVGRELSSTILETQLGVYLDREITAVVDRLLNAAGLPRLDSPYARIHGFGTGPVPVPEPAPAETTPSDEGSDTTADGDQQDVQEGDDFQEDVAVETDETDETDKSPEIEEERPGRDRGEAGDTTPRWHLSSGGGTSFIIGEAAELFRNSVFGRLAVEYTPERTGVDLSYGFSGTLHRIYTNDNVSGGKLCITTLGPSLGIGIVPEAIADIRAVLTAGPAIISVQDTDGDLTKTVSHVEVATAVSVPLHSRFAAGLSVGWIFVFEGDIIMQGLATALVAKFTF